MRFKVFKQYSIEYNILKKKMETGITIDDAVSEEFTKLRMKRTHRFLIF